MPYMSPPQPLRYNLARCKPGEPVDVLERDVNDLLAEGWVLAGEVPALDPGPDPEPRHAALDEIEEE